MPIPAVICGAAPPLLDDEDGSEVEVEVEVAVGSPCELVMVVVINDEEAAELDPDPELDPVEEADSEESVRVAKELVMEATASLALLIALPAAPVTCEAMEPPAEVTSEAAPSAPVTAAEARLRPPSTAVEAMPSAPLMMLLMPSPTKSWARTAEEERRRREVRVLSCIVVLDLDYENR